MPLNLKPKYYPTDPRPAAHMVIAAKLAGLDALTLSFAFQRGLWAEERDIEDPDERRRIADANGFDGAALLDAAEGAAAKALWVKNRTDAIARGIFGTPTYCFNGALYGARTGWTSSTKRWPPSDAPRDRPGRLAFAIMII